jgi:hypothetical protein
MKGKKILALASIFAGVALVGTTFANWVVTDNAAAKTIKISGEKISGDTDEREYVTLSYGENTVIEDVSNLAANTVRYAGKVGLVATYTGAESYKGLLSVEMSQTNQRSGDNLIDYLKVEVLDKLPTYDGDKVISAKASGTTTLLSLDGTLTTPKLSASASISMTTEEETPVYIAVELVEAAEDALILNTIKSDVVTLTLNWDHDSNGQTIAQGTTVYYKPSGAKDGEVYVWAWGGKSANADDFPGVAMTKGEDGIYHYTIDEAYDNFILSYNDNDGVNHQTDDFETDDIQGANVYFNGTNWTTIPTGLTAAYYLVGSFNGWDCAQAYALTESSTAGVYEIANVSLTEGQKLKVRTGPTAAEEHWYGCDSTWDNCGFTIDGEKNVVVSTTGTYTVHFNPNGMNNNYIYF